MKGKPFKAISAPNLAGKKASDRITRAELVALVASRIPRRTYDDDASARNRISAKVNYDVHWSGKLKEVASRIFTLGAVYDWARHEWPGFFDDLPHDTVMNAAPGTYMVHGDSVATIGARGPALPGDIAECHAAIMRMAEVIVERDHEVERLKAVLAASRAQAPTLLV